MRRKEGKERGGKKLGRKGIGTEERKAGTARKEKGRKRIRKDGVRKEREETGSQEGTPQGTCVPVWQPRRPAGRGPAHA